MDDTGGDDFVAPKSKKQQKFVRVVIGNIPTNTPNVKTSLQEILRGNAGLTAISENDITVDHSPQNNTNSSFCHAYITCRSNQDADKVISSLNRQEFHSHKLTVQRERKPKHSSNNSNSNNCKGGRKPNLKGFQQPASSFGKKSWSKPPPSQNSPSASLASPMSMSGSQPITDGGIASAAASQNSVTITDDKVADQKSALASLTAVSVLAPALEDSEQSNEPAKIILSAVTNIDGDTMQTLTNQENEQEGTNDVVISLEDFNSRCKKPLSDLLNDYGEEDPEWQAFQPKTMPDDTADDVQYPSNATTIKSRDAAEEETENRLGRQGKAPIHVEFVSFGYVHGAPAAVRNGWSHAQPLPVFETRDLPTVPGHLIWRDGVSGFVQRILLAEPDVRAMADSVGEKTFEALKEAIVEGGHGYVSPLQMKVYVGSENGRHRSVVVCENAAKKLRNLLRRNANHCITAPASVSTSHRDVARARKKAAQDRKDRMKEEIEGDW